MSTSRVGTRQFFMTAILTGRRKSASPSPGGAFAGILKGVAESDRRAQVESLFRQYGRGVGSYVLARVGDADLAETITSNVFLIVVRRIDQCRGSASAWLWSIVRSE